MRILLSTILLSLSVSASAVEVDWAAAEGGILFQNQIAYSGCANLSLSDSVAKKVALMKAAKNMARVKNLQISGEEHLSKSNDTTVLKYAIVESSSAYLSKTNILHEEVISDIESSSHLCILIAEKR